MVLSPMILKIVNRVCVDALVVYVALVMLGKFATNPTHLPTTPDMVDYRLNIDLSKSICDHLQYPPNFAYPLPGVLFWHGFGALNFNVGCLAWLFLLPACMIGSFVLARKLACDYEDRFYGIGMAIAFAATVYYLVWDLKAVNINSIYLAVVLFAVWCWQKEKIICAGILLAFATAVKVYSIAFLPYILLRREWRLAFTMLAAIAVFYVGIPVLYFGWHDALMLTRQWIAAVLSTSNPEYALHYSAYKYRVSLTWIAMLLLNPEASGGTLNIFNWSITSVGIAVKLASLVWLAMIASYFAANPQSGINPKHKRLAFTLDVSVLLFCLLLASPVLEPHHPVVLLVPAVCMARVLFDAGFAKAVRAAAGLTLGISACLIGLFHSPFRGVGVLLGMAAYLACIWIIRRAIRAPLTTSATSP
jgi:hypothetical protein